MERVPLLQRDMIACRETDRSWAVHEEPNGREGLQERG